MFQVKIFDDHYIKCEIIRMGIDYTIAIYGGDTPHVGSVVLSVPRPSLTGEGMSVTSSVLNRTGHKDEVIARVFSEAVAVKKKCTVVCVCGIHVDNVTSEQLEQIKRAGKKLLEYVLADVDEV